MTDKATTKPAKSVSSDKETMDDTIGLTLKTNECKYMTNDDKAMKKKLKKERQREKKGGGRERSATPHESDANKIERERMTKDQKEEMAINVGHDDNDPDESNNVDNWENEDDNEVVDIDFSTVVPAFIQSIVGSKDKTLKKHDTVKVKDTVKDTNHKNKLFPDDTDGFTCVKKGTKQAPAIFCKTPEGFGNQALVVIREGNFPLAINYLTRAIVLDPVDTRHYINRSYCYLRTGNYAGALADIKYASEHFSDITELAQAKCREGQALCGLQNYQEAERAFRDCINLSRNCSYAERELKRMQVLQMVHMGFKERDALLALQKQSTTMEAINVLTEKAPSNDSYESTESMSDDEIFYSDSEDYPSNERLLSKILNYDPNLPDDLLMPDEPPAAISKTVKNFKQPARAASVDRALRVIKTVGPPAKSKLQGQTINDKAIWVGNIPPHITEVMIQKKFTRYGKVTLVKRPIPNGTYVFVNFQCSTSAQKVLEEANYNNGNIELNGSYLSIKHAIKQCP